MSLKYSANVIPVYIDASLAATGMLDVLATKHVLYIIFSSRPLCVIDSYGNSFKTSAISLPLSPQPTYIMTYELEYFDSACEMTVLPQPNAPGMEQVPPNIDGNSASMTL